MTDDEKLWAGYARAALRAYAPGLGLGSAPLSAKDADKMLAAHRERWPAPAPDLDLERRLQEASDILQRVMANEFGPTLINDAQAWLDCGEKGAGE